MSRKDIVVKSIEGLSDAKLEQALVGFLTKHKLVNRWVSWLEQWNSMKQS